MGMEPTFVIGIRDRNDITLSLANLLWCIPIQKIGFKKIIEYTVSHADAYEEDKMKNTFKPILVSNFSFIDNWKDKYESMRFPIYNMIVQTVKLSNGVYKFRIKRSLIKTASVMTLEELVKTTYGTEAILKYLKRHGEDDDTEATPFDMALMEAFLAARRALGR